MSLISWFLLLSTLTTIAYTAKNYHSIRYKMEQLGSLFQEIKKRNESKNRLSLWFMTLNTVAKSWLYSYLHNCNVFETSEKNTFEVFFVIKSKLYKMRVKVPTGPNSIMAISSNGRDVTNDLLPYLGNDLTFHRNYTYTPTSFGFDKIKIARWVGMDLKQFEFNAFDPIVV